MHLVNRTFAELRIGDTAEHADKPEIRGMINTVTHLVTVEEVN